MSSNDTDGTKLKKCLGRVKGEDGCSNQCRRPPAPGEIYCAVHKPRLATTPSGTN